MDIIFLFPPAPTFQAAIPVRSGCRSGSGPGPGAGEGALSTAAPRDGPGVHRAAASSILVCHIHEFSWAGTT